MPNSLGRASLVLGDRWNLLILREAFRGARRFRDWTAALGISDPVLSNRLRDLTAAGVLTRAAEGYRLTAAGRSMWQIFVAIWLWDSRWAGPHDGTRPRLRHHTCGYDIIPLLACGHCGARGVTALETAVERHPGYGHAQSNPPRPYRRHAPSEPETAIDLLGDRWGTSVLAAALLGVQRFTDFAKDIDGIPRLTLTQRLRTFVGEGILSHRRPHYHLTAKGLDFFGIFSTEIAWSSAAFSDNGGPPLTISHRPCGTFEPVFACNVCNGVLEQQHIQFNGPAD
jgi:DNA-binding HxlR family transcriptional regulator